MQFFRHASIQQKQTRIIMGICTLALALSSAGYVAHGWFSRRAEMAAFLLVRGDVLGRTCWGALDFKDPKAAEDNLNALQADAHMVSVSVFTADGTFFARYSRAGAAVPVPRLTSTNAVAAFEGGLLRAARPVQRGGERLGFILLESDTRELAEALKYQVGIAALVFTLATALAYLLSARLQRLISGPILGLLDTTRAVARERNYTLRARKESEDELGQLVDGFNHMLLQVQNRDAELQESRNLLEKRVQDRTEALRLEVAERRRSEQSVLESRHFLQSTLDALSAHIAILDETGIILAVNAAWNRFARDNQHATGWLGAGTNYLEVCDRSQGDSSEEAPVVARGIRAVLAGDTAEFQLEYPCHSPDEQRWFIVRVTRFAGRGARRIVIAHENITSRKLSEERLNESLRSLAAFKAVLDRSFTIDMTDARGDITYANDNSCRISEYSREELLGQNHRLLNSGHHPTGFFSEMWKTIAGGEVWRGEVMNRAKSGRTYWVDTTIGPLLGEDGKPRGYMAIRTDISERKKTEQELSELNKQLIETSRQAGMAEIATGVLHNVGNVLNSVNVSANLLDDSARKSPVADLDRVVALLREQGDHLGQFFTSDPRGPKVRDFLGQLAETFARQRATQLGELASLVKNVEHIKDIVAMQQNYARVSGVAEAVFVTDLIEDTLRMNAGAFQRHELEVARDFAPDLPAIVTEKHKVLQILVNLVRNAKYACDDSGRTDKRLTVRSSHADGRVRIQVIDNGVGIPAGNLTRIFNHGFTTRKDGHGFGLHSGANAARELGGSLTAHSDGPGLGAVFTLELPVRPAEAGGRTSRSEAVSNETEAPHSNTEAATTRRGPERSAPSENAHRGLTRGTSPIRHGPPHPNPH